MVITGAGRARFVQVVTLASCLLMRRLEEFVVSGAGIGDHGDQANDETCRRCS